MRTFSTMYKTEFKLGLRNLDIPIFAIIFPMVVATILGLVYGRNNTEMIGKTFASVSTVGIAANGLMGLPLTLSGYRSAKILKQLKAAPVRSSTILLAQFMAKLTLSVISSFLILLILKLFFGYRFIGNVFLYILCYFLVTAAVFGIGMIIASISPNTNITGLLCSIVYFPMLFLSGATIPLDILPKSVVKILQILPLTQGINLLERVALAKPVGNDLAPVVMLSVIGFLSVIISVKSFKWE